MIVDIEICAVAIGTILCIASNSAAVIAPELAATAAAAATAAGVAAALPAVDASEIGAIKLFP